MADDLRVVIGTDGVMRFVWHDDLAMLADLGETTVTRASHVEPHPTGGWIADMAPSGGPVLGPVALRGDALALEREWLRTHRGL